MEGFIPIGGSAAPPRRFGEADGRPSPHDASERGRASTAHLVPPTPRAPGYTTPSVGGGVGAAAWQLEAAKAQEVLPSQLSSGLGTERPTSPSQRVEAFFASVEAARGSPPQRLSGAPEQ